MRKASHSSRCPIVTDSSPIPDRTFPHYGRTDGVTAVTAGAQRFSAVARFIGGFLAVLAIGGFLIACGNESSDGDAGEPPSPTGNPCPTPPNQPPHRTHARSS